MLSILAYKTPPPEVTGELTKLLGWLCWIVALICIAALLIAAGSFAWSRRMGQASLEEPGARVAFILIAATVVGSASAIAGALLV